MLPGYSENDTDELSWTTFMIPSK